MAGSYGLSFNFLLFLCYLISSARTDFEAEITLTEQNFALELNAGSHFVMFYAPWCGHCKRLHPIWSELARKYNDEQVAEFVTIAKVDCTVDTDLCSQQGVTGYPTLKLFNEGDMANGIKYRGKREIPAFDKFLHDNVKGIEDEAVPAADDDAAAAAEQQREAVATPEVVAKPVAEIEDGLAKLSTKTFDDHVSHGIHFVKFFAPWCGHCQRMAPAWDQLAKSFEDDEQVSIGRVDCTLDRDLCETHGVRGYPTLLVFINGEKEEKYQGSREFQELFAFITKTAKTFIDAKLNAKDIIPQVPAVDDLDFQVKTEPTMEPAKASVLTLTEDSFDAEVAEGLTLVKFFAPWCGHCQRLAPTWEDLGMKYSSQSNVKIAKVDCTEERSLCSRHSVNGYPTLFLFKSGSRVAEYEESRSLDALSDFIERHRGKDEL